jgi:diguanylate cyclase (GGDEF)-like protein
VAQRYDDPVDTAVDPITGLHRLGANGPSLATAIAVAGATKRRIALLHIDVDMFRSINTNMGTATGDQALAAIAQRLRRAVPREGWIWRLTSDEFVIGIGYRDGEMDGAGLAERLRDAFETRSTVPLKVLPGRASTLQAR